MDASHFDAMSKLFANRRLSRRQALAQGGVVLVAAGIAAAGLTSASAQEATPASATPGAAHGPTMLFLQSFQAGSIAPKPGDAGIYTLTLEQGLGQTIYFSDRPARIVGATPTPRFLAGGLFAPEKPPNAALLVEGEAGDTDIVVLELFNPRYEEATRTATYDVKLLEAWEQTLAIGFTQQPVDLVDVHASFGTAHLFIDSAGCPTHGEIICVFDAGGDPDTAGSITTDDNGQPLQWCFFDSEGICYPCSPTFPGDSPGQAILDYWDNQCRTRFGVCGETCRSDGVQRLG